MSENLPSNGRAAASCMIAAMFVVGCIDNFIVFIAETGQHLAISSVASRDCFASYFGSLCLWRGLDLAETLLGGAFAQSFLNNLNAVLFWLFGFYANGAGLGWAFYFAHFRIADHRIGVGGKDRTDTRDCGFFGLFGYFIGAQ